MPRSRLLPALVALLAGTALGACGGTAPVAEPDAPPPELGAPPAETGTPAETSGFAETGGGEPATTSTEPERPPGSEPKPPPIVLVTHAGRQEAVQGSYCVTQVSESGEGQGACADAAFVHPTQLSVVGPGEAVTIEVSDATVTVPEGSSGVSSTVAVYPLGCGPDRAVGDFDLESASMSWAVDLEPGAYELGVFAYFETEDGRSGDTYGVLGLLVDPGTGPAIVPVDKSLAVCPYPEPP
jgi:hypothetical protein